jgi:hypothetical protein
MPVVEGLVSVTVFFMNIASNIYRVLHMQAVAKRAGKVGEIVGPPTPPGATPGP